jgi:transposase-like protein
MLEVKTNHQIILLYFREGQSIRNIARKLKINARTVASRIKEYEEFKASPLSDQDKPRSLLNQYLKTGSVYDSSNRCKRKLTEDILAIIDACLLENDAKRLDGRMKQRLKKIDIHEKVLTAGHRISYCVVCEYIRSKTAQIQEAFIRQGYAEGSSCEFDWAEIKIKLDGKSRRYFLAVFTSAFSNYRFALLFERQDSLAFKEAHICFFEHIGGVYQQMLYDNMRVAIAQFVGKSEKVPTEGLLQLSRWYQYQWRFCNAAKGNEKGHVERSVEYIRRKTFAFKDDFKTFGEAQEYLLARVSELNQRPGTGHTDSCAVKLELERKGLCAHPGRMECFAGENHKVDKYSTICLGTNRYSVPDHLVGKMVFAKIYSQCIKIYEADRVLCQHQRVYERFSWQIDLNHYLFTLQRKPGAVGGSIALKQAPQWIQTMYTSHFTHDARSFIELLQYCQSHDISNQQLQGSVEKLSHRSSADITTDHVIALLGNGIGEVSLRGDEPDAIILRSMENLKELASMMSFN